MTVGSVKDRDRVALIAGAADEVGQAVALRMAASGARLALCGGAPETLRELAERINRNGGEAMTAAVDFADASTIAGCVADVVARYGVIDILVHNAPELPRKPLSLLAPQDFEAVLATTMVSPAEFMRAVAPLMRGRGHGRIVTVTSLAYLGDSKAANLAAAQAGIFGLTRSAALEVARDNVTVNTVVKGDMAHAAMSEADIITLSNGIPVKRLGTPVDLANAVAFFVADTSKYVTGQTFFVCGGKSAYYSMSV